MARGAAQRVVLHVDMDAFYVSVELRRRPELRGRPVVVGGTGPRGVVAAASYEARRYGVHSAMPSAVARRRCPDAVFLPGDHDEYARASRDVHRILGRHSPLVEPLALDEAFVDVTGTAPRFSWATFEGGEAIAHLIRHEVEAELDLRCSVGVAGNKFLAKLASVEAKPRAGPDAVRPGPGVVVVDPGTELDFVHPLPVERLWGVGPVTLGKLERLGIRHVRDLLAVPAHVLDSAVGRSTSTHLRELAQGRDDRPVEPDRPPKSIGHEETFPIDLSSRADVDREVVRLADAVAGRLRRRGLGARTFTVKVRSGRFATVTRSVTLADTVDVAPAIVDAVRPLLARLDLADGVRLLGISASNLAEPTEQLALAFGSAGPVAPGTGRAHADPSKVRAATEALDRIRERFGTTSIGPGAALGGEGLRPVRAGAHQWGPNVPGGTVDLGATIAPRNDDPGSEQRPARRGGADHADEPPRAR